MEGFAGINWDSVIESKSGKACRHLAEGCSCSGARAISAVLKKKIQTTETTSPVACCSPQTAQCCHIRRRMQAREERVDKTCRRSQSLCPCRAAESFTMDGLHEKLREFFARRYAKEGGLWRYSRLP